MQAMKTIEKKGLQAMAKEIGLDLYSLPYTDGRKERQEWLAQQPKYPPMVSPPARACTSLYGMQGVARTPVAPGHHAMHCAIACRWSIQWVAAIGRGRSGQWVLARPGRRCARTTLIEFVQQAECTNIVWRQSVQARDTIGKSRRMKNPEKLAASKKKPLVARYIIGGRVILTRDPKFVEEYREA
jgi:hypothetical protein